MNPQMEIKHNVEYMLHTEGVGSLKVDAYITQKELANLLMQNGVELLSVNKTATAHSPKRRK